KAQPALNKCPLTLKLLLRDLENRLTGNKVLQRLEQCLSHRKLCGLNVVVVVNRSLHYIFVEPLNVAAAQLDRKRKDRIDEPSFSGCYLARLHDLIGRNAAATVNWVAGIRMALGTEGR